MTGGRTWRTRATGWPRRWQTVAVAVPARSGIPSPQGRHYQAGAGPESRRAVRATRVAKVFPATFAETAVSCDAIVLYAEPLNQQPNLSGNGCRNSPRSAFIDN